MTRCGFVETGRGQAPKYPAVFYEQTLRAAPAAG
jgi:hypothetical protein